MKYIKRFEYLNQDDALFYMEVTPEVALSYCSGNPLPSNDPIPLNYQILEYAFGMPIGGATDEEYDEVAQENCDWYDGTLQSIKDGINTVNSFDFASEGPDFVLGINYEGNLEDESAEFGDLYIFFKDYRKIELIFVYDCKKEKYYSPHIFKNLYRTPGLYNNIDKFNL